MEEVLQYTQLITNVIIIILFIGILILVFGLIKQMKRITAKVDGFSKDLSDVKPKVMESLGKLELLADNVNSVVEKVDDHVDVLGTVVDKVKETADSVIEFEKKIQNSIEPPVMETLNTVTAVSVGVKTFFDSWRRANRKKKRIMCRKRKLKRLWNQFRKYRKN